MNVINPRNGMNLQAMFQILNVDVDETGDLVIIDWRSTTALFNRCYTIITCTVKKETSEKHSLKHTVNIEVKIAPYVSTSQNLIVENYNPEATKIAENKITWSWLRT